MKTEFFKYNPDTDFLRGRDFLVETFGMTEKPLNWKLERWNYTRYFTNPMLATGGIGEPDMGSVESTIQLWNDLTGVWENETGEIVGVVNVEHANKNHSLCGEVFFQHHPDYNAILPEMLEYAEIHLQNEENNQVFSPIYDFDEALIAAVEERGYHCIEENTLWDSIYTIDGEIPHPTLPDDYCLATMADDGSDIDRRRKAFGLGFNHPDPHDWPNRLSYEWLQQAPDYRADLDIFVVAPDGEYVSFCLGWWDVINKIVCLEPVGTVPEHRRKGLASAAVFEAIRRAVALGAGRAYVGSDQEFYLAIGFELSNPAHHWVKEF